MGFDAAKVVEPLDWDFSKYDAGTGTIPEPSDKAIDTLFSDIGKVSRGMLSQTGLDANSASPEDVIMALSDMPEGGPLVSQLIAPITKAFAKLCQNQPSVAQLNKLPLRIRVRFYSWLLGELNPEANGAGSPSQVAASGPNGQLIPVAFRRGA